jgi:predicted transcriptional regulator
VLRNANRRAVWEHARARPGVSVPELARGLGMKPGTVYFHVRVLAGSGLLAFADVRGARVLTVAGTPSSAAPSTPEAQPLQA